MKIAQGEMQQFIATAIYPNRSIDITTDVNTTWLTGRADIAVIGPSTGIAVGKSPGPANIAVSYKGTTYPYVQLIVTPPTMTITVTPNPATLNGFYSSQFFSAIGKYSDSAIPDVDLVALPSINKANWSCPTPGIVNNPFINAAHVFTLKTKEKGTTVIKVTWTTPYNETVTGLATLYYDGSNSKCSPNVDFLQIDSAWKDDLYANHTSSYPLYANPLTDTALPSVVILGGTIGSSGCTMVSMAMGLSTVGAYITPHTLNQEMLKPSQAMIQSTTIKLQSTYYGGNSGNEVDPQALIDFSKGNITSLDKGAVVGDIQAALDACNIVIVQIPYKTTGCGHWAILTGYQGTTYHAYDPTFGDRDFSEGQFCGKIWIGTVKK